MDLACWWEKVDVGERPEEGVSVPVVVLESLRETPLKISRGKSANAMVKAPMSPTRAIVTAEMGSHGRSSVLYSIGRYLKGQ